jgi:hypothetical protein
VQTQNFVVVHVLLAQKRKPETVNAEENRNGF